MSGLLKRGWQRLITGYRPEAMPTAPFDVFPDDFEIRTLDDTGVYVIENFCTPEEAADLVAVAKERLTRSGIVTADGKIGDSDERISHTAALYSSEFRYAPALPLMQRAAALVGLPYTHVEDVFVTRYQEGGFYAQHIDFGNTYAVDRLYTVLVYLNTVPEEQGGATVFPSLRAAVQPRVGRAVSWTNKNPDGSGHLETNHAAFPVKNGGVKWAIQFWFRKYRVSDVFAERRTKVPGFVPGSYEPLSGEESLPDGVSYTR